jgi:hypothetical protein
MNVTPAWAFEIPDDGRLVADAGASGRRVGLRPSEATNPV